MKFRNTDLLGLWSKENKNVSSMDRTEFVWDEIILENDEQINEFAQNFQEHSNTGFNEKAFQFYCF